MILVNDVRPTNLDKTCGTGLRCGTGFQPVEATGCRPVPHRSWSASLGVVLCGTVVIALASTACQSSGGSAAVKTGRGSRPAELNHVVTIYNKNPWLNADRAGDPDPEAIKFKIFLFRSRSDARSVLRNGIFHIDMYKIGRERGREVSRDLVADYHYSTDRVKRIPQPGLMGPGYIIGLIFPDKTIAGCEITILVTFEDEFGNMIRAQPKSLTVPKRT